MRKWGIVVTASYIFFVLVLLVPGFAFIVRGSVTLHNLMEVYSEWLIWVPIAIVLLGQALLLFLSVDTSRQHLKPRVHVLVSCLAGALLFFLLTVAAVSSLLAGVYGDKMPTPVEHVLDSGVEVLILCIALWLIWGIVFYLHFRSRSEVVARIMSWLLKGSVLELLVAVPCHVVVRRRDDCCAPAATGFGIAAGIAIMLLSFGPSVLLLYKKRLDAYSHTRPGAPS